MATDVLQKLNDFLLETETMAQEFLPLKATLEPIQADFQSALQILRNQASEATDPADRVFFINRYADLVKKMEGIFDTRSKRIQQSISMMSKIPDLQTPDSDLEDEEDEEEDSRITPEQASAILKILSSGSSKEDKKKALKKKGESEVSEPNDGDTES